MKTGLFEINENLLIAPDVYRMTLCGDVSEITVPGQFVNIKLEGKFLRRPISVYDRSEKSVSIIYKVVGSGTRIMSCAEPGDLLDVMTGLGNGYDLDKCGEKPLLIGGGVGVPPMYYLCKKLIEHGAQPTVIMGFNTESEIFCLDEFSSLCPTIVTTVDGSFGTKGFVTDAMGCIDYTHYCACGPEPMLRAVHAAALTDGQLSFEERMGCGFGACMGCSCKTKYGSKRICKDGPVLESEEVIW